MRKIELLEIAQAVSGSGRTALWLGSKWRSPDDEDSLSALSAVDWLGIWSDSKCRRFANAIEDRWRTENRPRHLVQVPGRLADALSDRFKLASVAPYFFLRGAEGEDEELDEILLQDARVDKIRQLARAQGATLIVDTQASQEEALKIAAESGVRCTDLYRIVLVGFDPENSADAISTFKAKHPTIAGKLAYHRSSLTDLLAEVRTYRPSESEELTVRIGNQAVRIASLLNQEPPITQDFAVLTERDIDPSPRNDEPLDELLLRLLAGRKGIWRSIACGVAWDARAELTSWREQLAESIAAVRRDDKRVVVIDAPAEAGSGLSTLLCQLAVYAASQRCPTLFHLAAEPSLAYSQLRVFLTDLYRDVGKANITTPAVIVFDADSVWTDAYGQIDRLPGRLNRDGRRAVILRARPQRSEWFHEKPTPRDTHSVQYVRFTPPLREQMSHADALKLAGWVTRQYRQLNDAELPTDWYGEFKRLGTESGCPFLLTLSILLVERYREAAKLGERLVGRVKRMGRALEADRAELPLLAEDETPDALAKAITLGQKLGLPDSMRVADAYAAVCILSAMGCLKLPVPRRVLGDLAGIRADEVFNVLLMLERIGVATTREYVPPMAFGHPRAAGAFRTKPATVQMAHHEYGRLILEWLVSPRGAEDRALLTDRDVSKELVRVGSELIDHGRIHTFPLPLLRPVLELLSPGNDDDKRFAEEVAQRFLRVQREKVASGTDASATRGHDQGFHRWQWAHRIQILRAFKWFPAEMVNTSAPILHSRAITEAKSTRDESPHQARPLYMAAEDDLIDGLEKAEVDQSDNPAHMLATLGMVYVHWADMERRCDDPENRAAELDKLADDTLREARELQVDSSYPAFHLATHKVNTAEFLINSGALGSESAVADNIGEALQLLSADPEPGFKADWDELLRRAVGLLADKGRSVIETLKAKHRILGWTLEALLELNGEFPIEPDPEINEQNLERAWRIMEQATADPDIDKAPIASLLRYAVFSVRSERQVHPAYDLRYQLIREIEGTRYMTEPVWLYDYGMLCFQNGEYAKGSDAFKELRRGQRFYCVSNDRAVVMTIGPDDPRPKRFLMQVQSVERRTGHGWCRIQHPEPFRDPIPFAVRAFESRGEDIQVRRAGIPCIVTIRPAGPFAEPRPAK